jgi:hypothetical protein
VGSTPSRSKALAHRRSIRIVRTLFDRAGGADPHATPPFEQAVALVKLHAPGTLVALPHPAADGLGMLRDRGCAPTAVLLQNDLVVGVAGRQHRDEVIIELRGNEPELNGTRGHVSQGPWIAVAGIPIEAPKELVDAVAVFVLRLDDEGKIDILAFDVRVPAHVAPEARVLGKGTSLGCRRDDEAIGGRLAGDDAPDVGSLRPDRLARVGFRADPVDKGGEPPVRAALHGRRADLGGKSLSHEITSLSGNYVPFRPSGAPRTTVVINNVGEST